MSPQQHINGCEGDENPAGHPKTSGQAGPFHNGADGTHQAQNPPTRQGELPPSAQTFKLLMLLQKSP